VKAAGEQASPLEDYELVSEGQDLSRKGHPRMNDGRQSGEKELDHREYPTRIPGQAGSKRSSRNVV
jgi:hypothetical protein